MVGDTLLVASRKGRLAALNPENGQLVWALPIELGKTLLADPLPQGDVAYYSAQGGDVYKVTPKDGSAVKLAIFEPGALTATPTTGTPTPSPTPSGAAGPSPTQVGTP
jgi:hypothetical protein